MSIKDIDYQEALCLDHACVCHTDEAERVRTPFPADLGNAFCCCRCHRTRRPIAEARGWLDGGKS